MKTEKAGPGKKKESELGVSSIDSDYYGKMFASSEMAEIFGDDGRLQAWLDFEAALARAQARLGIIPEDASRMIQQKARLEFIDQQEMQEEFVRVGFPILPMVRQLAKAVGPDAARYVHWGSTTQDVTDTGAVLQFRKALDLVEGRLDELCHVLARTAELHRDTVMVGRTLTQQAAPITFGYKVAIWLAEILRHRERLQQVRPRVLVGQVAGAVGSNATLGAMAADVQRETLRELDLCAPPITWHVSRDGWTELAALLALIGGSLGKIAREILTLNRTEIGELAEPFIHGRGASSTLPQKRNPITCQPVVAAAKMLREKASLSLDVLIQENERSAGPMHLEWTLLPEAFVILDGALKNLLSILPGLVVDKSRMIANLDLTRGMVVAEAVMMGLAPHIGREKAHELVYDLCKKGLEENRRLQDVLLEDSTITAHLSESDVRSLLDPANYTGMCRDMTDRVLGLYRAALVADPTETETE